MADLDAFLGDAPVAEQPYAGMTDQEVAATASSNHGAGGALQMRMYNPDNAKTVARIADQARGASKEASGIDDFLGAEPVKLNSKMTNDQLLSHVGYSKDDIAKLKTDPVYKVFESLDGENFLAKEIAEPGKLQETMQKIPAIGAFLHGADESVFGVAQLLTHAAHAVGAAPETTPALFDALAKVNEKAYEHNWGVKSDEYLVPKVLGGIVSGGALGKVATLGRGVVAAEAGVAAAAKTAQATRLAQAGRALKGGAGVAAGGAGGAVALTPTTTTPSEVSQGSRDAFWQHKGEDAKQGAIWALGMHGVMKTMFKAGLHVKNKAENSAKITNILNQVRQNAPKGSEEYQKTLDALTPLFTKPEYAERELNFAMNHVDATVGDISHGLVTKGTEKLASGLPFGLGKFREAQGQQVGKAANKYAAELYDKMINAKFSSVKELEEAAKAGGAKSEAAKNILAEMRNSGASPAQIMQISAESNGIRKWLISRKMFAARDSLAGSATLNVENARNVANELLGSKQLSVPGANKAVKQHIGEIATYLADPVNPKGYDSIEAIIRNLDEPIDRMGKAAGPLIDLQRALKKAQTDFTDNVHKYSKAERYGIEAKNLAPAFKASRGRGYDFTALRPLEADPAEPGVRLFADAKEMRAAGITPSGAPEGVKLRSPVVVEGPNGLTEFKAKLGLPDDASEEVVTKAALQYAKSAGHDGVVFTWNGTPRQVIDLTKWKHQIGDAERRAQTYYKENLGAMERQTNASIVQSNADNIVDKAVDRKGVEAATRYFKEFDDKGQAALRANVVERAVKQATNPDGSVDTRQIAKYLHDRREALGVFFKGEEKWALNGFIKLMDEAGSASVKSGHGLTGSIMMAEALLDVARSGHPVEAVKGAAKTYASLSAVGAATASFAKNPTMRRMLLAADNAKAGSEKMQALVKQFTTLLAGSAVGKANGGNE